MFRLWYMHLIFIWLTHCYFIVIAGIEIVERVIGVLHVMIHILFHGADGIICRNGWPSFLVSLDLSNQHRRWLYLCIWGCGHTFLRSRWCAPSHLDRKKIF